MQTQSGNVIPLMPMALATVVEETPGVQRFQVIQTAPKTLRLRLEMAPGEDEAQVWAMVTSRLQEYLEAQGLPSISLDRDSELPRPNPIHGKFRHIWTELPTPTIGIYPRRPS